MPSARVTNPCHGQRVFHRLAARFTFMSEPYTQRPTLVFRAKRLIPAPFIHAMIISTVAVILSLALFGLFVFFSGGVNPFDVYRVMLRGAFGTPYAWRNTFIHAAPLLLTALC